MTAQHDTAHETCFVRVDKYFEDTVEWVRGKTGILTPSSSVLEGLVKPDEVAFGPTPGNRLVTVGLARMTGQLLSNTQVWDNTHAALAVGDSATGDAIGDSDLLGTNKYYMTMDSTYPSASNGVITFKATYASGVANFAWNEYGAIVPNTATAYTAGTTKQTSYVLFNRKAPAALGTKSTGTWVLTMTMTIT